MSLLLRGGRVIDPGRQRDEVADVLIEGGRIQAVGPEEAQGTGHRAQGPDSVRHAPCSVLAGPQGAGPGLVDPEAEVIDATGLVVAPGFIDLHVHLREPGFERKETIASGTRAAARGGFTGVSCMPNTRPVIDSAAALEDLRARVERDAVVHVYPQASLTRGLGQAELSDFSELTGAAALTDDAGPIQSAALMREALRRAAEQGLLVTVHCEDRSLTEGGVISEGEVSRRLGLGGMPACAEDIMVARNILLAADVGCPLHVLHVSTAGSVALVRAAKERGWAVTAEACPHHFALTEEAVLARGANAKMNPPLRTAADVAAIKEGLRDGTIDAIATDHAPHTPEEKARGLQDAPFGIVGLETALPVVLVELVETGLLTLPEAIAKLTLAPARILGLDRGTLAPGAAADVTLFDPAANVVIDPETFASRSRNTPFGGRRLRGKVVATIVDGKIVYRNDEEAP